MHKCSNCGCAAKTKKKLPQHLSTHVQTQPHLKYFKQKQKTAYTDKTYTQIHSPQKNQRYVNRSITCLCTF